MCIFTCQVTTFSNKTLDVYHRQMKIRFLKISQVIDNQVIVKNIETENSIADGIVFVSFIRLPNGRTRKCVLLKNQSPPQV
jgi:hypothetical protein